MSDSPVRAHGRLGSLWRYALAGTISLVAWAATAIGFAEGEINDQPIVGWFLVGDTLLGVASFVLVHLRHRRPALVAVLTGAFSSVSVSSAGPAIWMVGSLTSRHRWQLLWLVVPLNVAAGVVQERLYPGEDDLPVWAAILLGVLVIAVVVAVGYAMGSQRDLMTSLRERADTAEREQQARVARAQTAERTRIAREMHDVLAHRISLVAMHAGALGYRTDLTAEEQGTAARTIEENAHQALRDLRDVLGVLRDPTAPADAPPELPQPVIGDITRLVDEERAGGMRVTLENTLVGEPPDVRARTAYRVVQEALTNARKHAVGTAVTVTLAGNVDEGLTVRVRNAAPTGARGSGWPDSGLGLVGLHERVALAGGRIEHGPDTTGGWSLTAWIPWRV
ncbi:sensor histidine kinase [Knoellia aerolata]|uniref:histidine kinase n=1 Tax=Knoellia aerolata DSM 18566 TaxID=1385519 RepID=A0A0A0JRI6_9MICO|nr:histidine kinase [Knoellia aerolata]KGN40015.1 hypothetical protein N801_16800 [Knoellia aerolata DSM 18566]